jgi:diketogulonate reductase-like aldo/keto reductase
VRRDDVFVVSKVWATYTTRVELGLDKSLKSLGLDYVDLFLVVSNPASVECEHLDTEGDRG